MIALFLALPLFFSFLAVAYHFGQRHERIANEKTNSLPAFLIGSRICSILSDALEADKLKADRPFHVVIDFENGCITKVMLLQSSPEAE